MSDLTRYRLQGESIAIEADQGGLVLHDDAAALVAEKDAEIERLREQVKGLSSLLDEQLGTPCEQIRHQQEIERLRAALTVIRHQWAGHSEMCSSYLDSHDACDCDWPQIAKQCDDALNASVCKESDDA